MIDTTNTNTKKPLYLNFIEELSIEKSELIGDLMTAEVMESSRPVRTHRPLVFSTKFYSADWL